MKNKPDKVVFIVSLIGTILGVLFIMWIVKQLFIVRDEVERSQQATVYDMECLTQPIERPLQDCVLNK